MDENQKKLLEEFGVLVLPDTIEHETFELVLEATLIRPDEQIKMYCRGDGGGSWATLAIVDIIQAHGQVVGVLPGVAVSSHVIVWAGCAERYVYPNALIGVHKIAINGDGTRIDAVTARSRAEEYDQIETMGATLLASISNKVKTFWQEMFDAAGSGGLKLFNANKIIEMGMARPIEDLAHEGMTK